MGVYAIRLGLILSLSLLWFFANTDQSLACYCGIWDGDSRFTPSDVLDHYDSVYSGRVTAIRDFEDPKRAEDSWKEVIVAFEVATVWKGPLYETAYLSVVPATSCSYEFAEDEEYLVYSSDGSTSACSRTASFKHERAQADLDELRKGRKPLPGTTGPLPGTPGFPPQQSPDIEWVTPASGGCSLGSATPDAAWLSIKAGLVWFGVRRRPRR